MQPMTPAEIDRLLDEHFAGEIGKDVEATLDTFTDDIEHDVAGAPAASHGKQQAAGFYHDLFDQLTILRLDTTRRLYGPTFAVDDAVATCVADGRPFGFEGRGRRFSFRLLHVFEFADGRIHRENAWVDMAAVAQQLA
jgi:uncharacterized protein